MANITAAEHPELVLEMTAMERTTPAHYDEWNVRHQQLLNNDKYLNEQCLVLHYMIQDVTIFSSRCSG